MSGMFAEGKDNVVPRGFSRTFIAQRENADSFLIVNDQLHVRNLSDAQTDLYEDATTAAAQQQQQSPQQVLHLLFNTV